MMIPNPYLRLNFIFSHSILALHVFIFSDILIRWKSGATSDKTTYSRKKFLLYTGQSFRKSRWRLSFFKKRMFQPILDEPRVPLKTPEELAALKLKLQKKKKAFFTALKQKRKAVLRLKNRWKVLNRIKKNNILKRKIVEDLKIYFKKILKYSKVFPKKILQGLEIDEETTFNTPFLQKSIKKFFQKLKKAETVLNYLKKMKKRLEKLSRQVVRRQVGLKKFDIRKKIDIKKTLEIMEKKERKKKNKKRFKVIVAFYKLIKTMEIGLYKIILFSKRNIKSLTERYSVSKNSKKN